MKPKAKVIIVILSVLLSASVIFNIKILSEIPKNMIVLRKNVPDEEAAIGIAKVIYKVYTGAELNDDDFSCGEYGNKWQVRLKNEQDFGESVLILDESGIIINKYTGTIMEAAINEQYVEDYMKLKDKYK